MRDGWIPKLGPLHAVGTRRDATLGHADLPAPRVCSTRGAVVRSDSIGRSKDAEEDEFRMATTAVARLKRKLPDRLAQIRGDRSQRQFARDLGVFQQNVNRYESGTTPHTDFLITLALKESISIDWLLLGKGRMRRSR